MLGYLWTPKLIVVEFWAGSQRLNIGLRKLVHTSN